VDSGRRMGRRQSRVSSGEFGRRAHTHPQQWNTRNGVREKKRKKKKEEKENKRLIDGAITRGKIEQRNERQERERERLRVLRGKGIKGPSCDGRAGHLLLVASPSPSLQ